MTRRFVVTLILAALALSTGPVIAQESDMSIEDVLIEEAQSPTQHQALAKHFRAEASKARALAERHASMARSYQRAKKVNKQGARNHCLRIAEQQREIASQFDGLAEMHEAAAKDAS